jgi:hypothetical protein
MITLSQHKEIIRSHGVKGTLLSIPDHNPKLAKAEKIGILSAPLHLAPAKLSGFNVCPASTAGCRSSCLHTAGAPQYMSGKSASRIARTVAYFKARESFMAVLVAEIAAHVRKAGRLGMKPAVRLNATSDIAWERVKVTVGGVEHASVYEAFPDVQFYDYTKIAKRAIAFGQGKMPANYHLTFSLAESNESDAVKVLAAGGNVSVVFDTQLSRWDTKIKRALPMGYDLGGILWPVVDGDVHDYRPLDGSGVIVGLRAKGAACGTGSATGFVRPVPAGMFRVDSPFRPWNTLRHDFVNEGSLRIAA